MMEPGRVNEQDAPIQRSNDVQQTQNVPVLDGIRALSCLGVISFHLNLWSMVGGIWPPPSDTASATLGSLALSGEMCIILFFILSGFLLFLPYARALLSDTVRWPSPGKFYLRRIFRILPGYYVALGLMIVYLHPEYLQPHYWARVWLFIVMQMDFPSVYQQINAPFWTLAIEWQFYLLLPLIAWVMMKIVRCGTMKQRLFKIFACLTVLFLWGGATRYWGVIVAPKMDMVLSPTVSDILLNALYGARGKFYDSFALGMGICVIYVYQQNTASRERLSSVLRHLSPWLLVLALAILVFTNVWHYYAIYAVGRAFHFLDPIGGFLVSSHKDVLMPILFELGYALLLFAILFGPSQLKRPLEAAPLRGIGRISYSLYLWHDPFILFFLFSLLPNFQHLDWSSAAQYAVYVLWILITAFPVAVVLYRWVEMPAVRRGERVMKFLSRSRHTARGQEEGTERASSDLNMDARSGQVISTTGTRVTQDEVTVRR